MHHFTCKKNTSGLLIIITGILIISGLAVHSVFAQITSEQLKSVTETSDKQIESGRINKEHPSEPAQSAPLIMLSQVENMFNQRFLQESERPILQYGYNYFQKFVKEKYLPVGDQYIVGPGDSIAIYFWGAPVDILKLKGFHTLTVDREGKIYISKLGVFYVWGLRIADIKDLLDKAMSKKFRNYEIEVTLGKLREFPVYVSGFVKEPGMVLSTGTTTVIDAISLAGGIEKNGSLRNITLKRLIEGATETVTIDLYDLLINGKPMDLILKEGNTIYVNPIKHFAGISGGVKRPSIYELVQNKTSIRELVALAGGVLPSAHKPGVKLYRYMNDTTEITEGTLDDEAFLGTILKSGDYVTIENIHNLVDNEILVKGHVSYPGKYSYKGGMKLADLIKAAGLLPDTNKHSAGIWRDKANRVINFNPEDVLSGKADVEIKKRDFVIFYPKRREDPIQIMGEISNPSVVQYHSNITLLEVMQNIKFKVPVHDLKAEIFAITEEDNNKKTIYLNDLLVKGEKDENIYLLPGTRILIKKTEANERKKSVTVLGCINKPGVYNFAEKTSLYDLLVMAGGYTGNAYPRGLILVRNSARKLQEEHLKISFLSMREYMVNQTQKLSGLGGGTGAEERAIIQMTLSRYEQMLDIMKKKSELALGRIALDIPDKIEDLKNDHDNIMLTDGDFVYVPMEPNYVLILGDVYNQMSLPHDSGKTVKYYLNQLGGLSENADRENMYIIKANGKIISRKQYSSLKNLFFSIDWTKKKMNFNQDFDTIKLEKGDTIVVPTELKVPVPWRPILKDIAQIMFQTMSTVVLATRI